MKTLAAAVLMCLSLCHSLARAGPFDLAGGPASRVVLTLPDVAPVAGEGQGSPMLDRIAGTVARLSKKHAAQLRSCVEPRPLPLDALRRYWTLHLSSEGKAGREITKRVEILRDVAGEWYALPLADANVKGRAKESADMVALNREKFAAIAADWPKYLGKFEADPKQTPWGKPAILAAASPAWWTMDKATLGERFLAGRPTNIDGAKRVLSDNKFRVRLPKDYDPRECCGVLVWVDANDVSRLHECFWPAADELRIILIGAEKTGNDVPAADRDQLALDASQTVQEQFLCDEGRVYVSGISGGGRISSQLWACFPDVFTGAVPIVGLDCYEPAPAGEGKYHRNGYMKPAMKMWRQVLPHRLGVMTGPPDFNYGEIVKFVATFKRDKVDARVFEYPDMAHQLPTAPRFSDAMSWVDEPVRTSREASAKTAAELAAKEGRPEWVEATNVAPWSKGAWAAAEKLGLVPGTKGK